MIYYVKHSRGLISPWITLQTRWTIPNRKAGTYMKPTIDLTQKLIYVLGCTKIIVLIYLLTTNTKNVYSHYYYNKERSREICFLLYLPAYSKQLVLGIQRVRFTNAERPSDFLRNNHTSQIIYSSNNSCCFHNVLHSF